MLVNRRRASLARGGEGMAVPFCSLPASCGGGDERPELALFVAMRSGGEGWDAAVIVSLC